MVVVEVIDALAVFESHVVDVTYFGGPFEVIVRRPDIFVLVPTFLNESLSELSVSSFDDEYSLIVAYSIFALPCLEINNFLLFLKFFLLDVFILIIVNLFLIFLFARTVGRYLTLGFVLQAP